MNFIKKIFDGKRDESVHLQFQKFSRGEFKDRALIEAKNSSGKFTIKTSAEFGNELVRIMAEKLGNNKTKVQGVIVSTLDLKGRVDFKEVKQFQGVKKYVLDMEMSGDEILGLLDELPKNFFGLSFKVGDDELKIKAKAPKSGKPGSKEEAPKADFCTLKTTDKEIAKGFVFEKPDFKEAKINHKFMIENIIVPEELKKCGDFAKMREDAIRKGKIVRISEIDGQKSETQKEFEA